MLIGQHGLEVKRGLFMDLLLLIVTLNINPFLDKAVGAANYFLSHLTQ